MILKATPVFQLGGVCCDTHYILERSRFIVYYYLRLKRGENMTHEYEGRYREKHSSNIQPDSTLAKLIREKAEGERLACASAFTIAKETGAPAAEIGRTADLLEIKINKCQLGLFGYTGEKRNIAKPAETVSAELEQALRAGVVDGRLPCKSGWEIAEQFGLSKMEITSACEKLNIRLGPCQLGTF
jgi:hypothetical protein